MENGEEASMPTVRQMWLAMKQLQLDMSEMKGQISLLSQKMGRVETVISSSNSWGWMTFLVEIRRVFVQSNTK